MSWIKIHTKLLDWEWVSCPETLALWIHILLRANYEDRKWQGMMITRGSFVTSISNLSSATGLSPQQIRTGLKRLVSTNEISLSSTNKYTIITICKYGSYQVSEDQSNNQATNKQQTNNKQITTTTEYKNTRYKENISKEIEKKVSEIDSEAQKTTCRKPTLDLSFVSPELKDIFNEFLDMRRKIGKTIKTQKCINERYNKLLKLSGGDNDLAIQIARQTIANEWQDFYQLKSEQRQNNPHTQQEYTNDQYW